MPKAQRYWVRIGERNFGPFTVEEVRRRTDVGPENLLCPEGKKGGSDWKPLAEFPEFDASGSDAPLPPDRPADRPTPRQAPIEESSPQSAAGSMLGDAARTVVRAVLTGVFGFILLMTVMIVISANQPDSKGNNSSAPAAPQRALPAIEYDNKWTQQVVECTDFRWGEYGDLYFKVRFKSGASNFTEGGTLRFEAYDAQGTVVFSGVVGSYSAGQNSKVYEESITLRKEKMDRVVRVVFGI